MYPIIIFIVGLIGFEFLRLRLYPTLIQMMQSFNYEPNRYLSFFAFHSLKIILIVVLSIFVIYRRFPRYANIIQTVRQYRSLNFALNLATLIQGGGSMAYAFKQLAESFNQSIYPTRELEDYLLKQKPLPLLSSYDSSFIKLLSIGIEANQVTQTLNDYIYIYQTVIQNKFKRIGQLIQLGLFVVIAANIFLIYAVMMLPMFQISSQL